MESISSTVSRNNSQVDMTQRILNFTEGERIVMGRKEKQERKEREKDRKERDNDRKEREKKEDS